MLKGTVTKKALCESIKTKIDTLIALFRKEFNLNLPKDSKGKVIDPLLSHEFGKHLCTIRQAVTDALTNNAKSRFNFQAITMLTQGAQQKKFSAAISQAINELYQIIIMDIQRPGPDGGYFLYQEISCDKAAEIIDTLHRNNTKDTPAGAGIWRVCFGLIPEQANQFFAQHGNLVTAIRRLPSYQQFQLFDENNAIHHYTSILDNPWLLTFFTSEQLSAFINMSVFDKKQVPDQIRKHPVIQGLMALVSHDDDTASSGPKRFFSSRKNPNSTLQEQQEQVIRSILKNTLVRFITHNKNHSRQVVSEALVEFNFIWACGVFEEWLSLLEPLDIIELFPIMDHIILTERMSGRAEGKKAPTNASELQEYAEYTWLYARIIQDLNKGDATTYFAKVITIPYILYYLAPLPEFYKVSREKLALFFQQVEPRLVLQALGLFDPCDKTPDHCFLTIKNAKFPVGPVTEVGGKQLVKKEESKYQQLAKLLLSDEFLSVRKQWLQNETAHQVFISFPFLLRGLDSQAIRTFFNENKVTITTNADNCISNGVNPYVHCPVLLQYLDIDKILVLYGSHAEVKELFMGKNLPAKVIAGYIRQGAIEIMPHLVRHYLDIAYFKQMDAELFDESLLLGMLNSEICREFLKNHPSVLDRFDPKIVAACAQRPDEIFLRQVIRQNILMRLIRENFDDLKNRKNFASLMGNMITALYKNPESDAIITRVKQQLQAMRDEVYQRYDVATEGELITLALNTLGFKDGKLSLAEPYSHTEVFPEQKELEEITGMVEEKSTDVDPIIYAVTPILVNYPAWTSPLMESGGFTPALVEYFFQIIEKSVGGLKTTHDHCPAIYQYAILLIGQNKHEDAAEYLEDYINHLGVYSDIAHPNKSAFYLLLTCANNLAKSEPIKAMPYYNYLATALLVSIPIKSIKVKLLKCLEPALTAEERKRYEPDTNVVRAKCARHEMTLALATGVQQFMEKHLQELEVKQLALRIEELLIQTIAGDHYSPRITAQAKYLKQQFVEFIRRLGDKDEDKLLGTLTTFLSKTSSELAVRVQQFLQEHGQELKVKQLDLRIIHQLLIRTMNGDHHFPSMTDQTIISRDKFIEFIQHLEHKENLKAPAGIKKSGRKWRRPSADPSLLPHVEEKTIATIADIISNSQLDTNVSVSPDTTLIKRRIAIHKEMEDKSISPVIRQRLENIKVDVNKANTTGQEKKLFSPYSREKTREEIEQLLENIALPRQVSATSSQVFAPRTGIDDRLKLSAEQVDAALKAEEIKRKQALKAQPAQFGVTSDVPEYADEEAIIRKADERLRRKADKEAQKKQSEEEARRKQAEEEIKKKQLEEEARERLAKDSATKKQTEEEARLKREEDENEKKRVAEYAKKEAEYKAQVKREEEEAQRRAKGENDSLAEAVKLAKAKEQKHKAFFDEQDRQKQLAKAAQEERDRKSRARSSSVGAPSSSNPFLGQRAGEPLAPPAAAVTKNIIGPGAPIRRAPESATVCETPAQSAAKEEEAKKALALLRKVAADEQAELRRRETERQQRAQNNTQGTPGMKRSASEGKLKTTIPVHLAATAAHSDEHPPPPPTNRDGAPPQGTAVSNRRVDTDTMKFGAFKEEEPPVQTDSADSADSANARGRVRRTGSFTSVKAVQSFFEAPTPAAVATPKTPARATLVRTDSATASPARGVRLASGVEGREGQKTGDQAPSSASAKQPPSGKRLTIFGGVKQAVGEATQAVVEAVPAIPRKIVRSVSAGRLDPGGPRKPG